MGQRDSRMSKWVQETDKAEREGSTIDQRILDCAKTSGLVSDPEFKKLTYLKDMRNSFAHPTGAAPTDEEVSAALKIAVDTVLSKPPLLGYGFARELAEKFFQDLHFLDDVEDKVISYVDQLRPLLNPEVIPWLAEQVITRLDPILPDPQLAPFTRRGMWFTRQLLATADVDSSPKWRIEKVLNDHPSAACLIAGDVRIFPRIGSQLQDRVFGWLAEPTSSGKVVQPSVTGLTVLVALDDAALLDERKQTRLGEAIGRTSYSTLLQEAPFRVWARKVTDDLASHNWYTQNPAASALRSIGPVALASCDPAVLESIGRALLAAADGTAQDAEGLMYRLRNGDGQDWPSAFVKGLLLETVVREDGTFRVKAKLMPDVVDIVNQNPVSDTIIDDVLRQINEAAPKNRRSALRNGLEELELIYASTGQELIRKLTEIIQALVGDDNVQ